MITLPCNSQLGKWITCLVLSPLAVFLGGPVLHGQSASKPELNGKQPLIEIGARGKHYADVTYWEKGKEKLQLDLVVPTEGKGPFPAIVIIHGAGPTAKNRQHYLPQAKEFASAGYVGVTISFRNSAASPYPNSIEDAEAAIRWLRTNAAKYKIDPNRIAALGYSGGGALACLLGMERPAAKKAPNGVSSRVQAVVAYYPPTDFIQFHKDCANMPLLRRVFIRSSFEQWLNGNPDDAKARARYEEASPIHHVHKDMAPLFLIHGMYDAVVPFDQSDRLVKRIAEKKGNVTVLFLTGAGHNFNEENSFNSRLAKESANLFLKTHLVP